MRTLDLFCGGGGSSVGARIAGAEIVAGVDRDDAAISAFKLNHPNVASIADDIASVDPQAFGRIDLILASPPCTNFSRAIGARTPAEQNKHLVLEVARFAKALRPEWVVTENVAPIRQAEEYVKYKALMVETGYYLVECILTASRFGVPQRRKRLFTIARLGNLPPRIVNSGSKEPPARNIVDLDGKGHPLYLPARPQKTIGRYEKGLAALGKVPFLILYYGHQRSWFQSLDSPIATIPTRDRFGLIQFRGDEPVLRMLRVDELQKGMGFPNSYRFPKGMGHSTRAKILGNAVCPPVMAAIVRALRRYRAGRTGFAF